MEDPNMDKNYPQIARDMANYIDRLEKKNYELQMLNDKLAKDLYELKNRTKGVYRTDDVQRS